MINNIVKEFLMIGEKSILVPVYKRKCDPLMFGSYAIRLLEQAIKVLEQPMKVLERG